MEMSFSKKHEASYVFSDNINRISKILHDRKVIEDLNSQTQLPYLFTDKPIPLSFNYSLIEFTCVEHKNKLIWMITSPNLPSSIHYTFNLVSNTLDNSTLLVFEIYIVNPEEIPIDKHKKVMSGSKEICVEMINAIDKALQMNYDNIIQCSSIIIKASRQKMWDYFVNLTFLKNKDIRDLKFVGNRDQVGTEVSWIGNKENIKCSCRIIKASNREESKKWQLKLKALEGIFQSQEIQFTMIKLSDKETFISICHKFNELVTAEILKQVEEKKTKNLALLKLSLECEDEVKVNGNHMK